MIRAVLDYVRLKHHRKRFSQKRLHRYQWRALKKLLGHAAKHSPFYQKRFEGKTVESFEDFHKLPSIDKTAMMENFTTLNTHGLVKEDVMAYAVDKEKNKDYLGYYQDKFVVGLSSGTSGNKGLFLTPKSLTKRLPGVFLASGGISLRDLPLRILFMLRVFSQGFDDINAPLLKLKYLSTMTPVETIVETVKTQSTNLLMAPPSLLRFLLPHKNELAGRFKKVITYAEVLTAEEKARFEQAFDCAVVEIYQASEGQIASPCEKGNLHINEDLVYLELYDRDGNPVTTPGVVGHKMVLTNLVNTAQPLIRYEMNDMVVLDEPCSCKSAFRTVRHILGRHDDILYFLDQEGNPKPVYPDLFARWVITESDAIREFQAVQKRPGETTVLVDLLEDFDTERLKRRIEEELDAFGLHGEITIEKKAIELPKDKNKYKRFVSFVESEENS